MKCGKTTRLIEEFNKYVHTDKRIKMFKPCIDNRFHQDAVCDRNSNKIDAINIAGIQDLLLFKDTVDIYFIDEFQFLGGEVAPILQLVDDGKIFFIAGLNLTAERMPFGQMHRLLCCADNIINLTAICDVCKEDESIFTFCTAHKVGDILVGDSEYLTVCPRCYKELNNREIL